ncbi:conserved hypothetical protein, membrane [Beggiatoa sp. SS]|nr:conserved hypothetical protein, membrane [Beggiatoa sp. SS]
MVIWLIISGLILWWISRDHLHSRHALWWVLVALSVMMLGIFPALIDQGAIQLGINYPPTLVFILGMVMILVKVISIDIHQCDLERKMRGLAQRLGILEGEKNEEEMGERKGEKG